MSDNELVERIHMLQTEISHMKHDQRLLIELYDMLSKQVYVDPEGIVIKNQEAFSDIMQQLRDEVFRVNLIVT